MPSLNSVTSPRLLKIFFQPTGKPNERDHCGAQVATGHSKEGKAVFVHDGAPTDGETSTEFERIHSVDTAPEKRRTDRLQTSQPTRVVDLPGHIVRVSPVTSWSIAPDGRLVFIRMPPGEARHEYLRAIFPDRIPVIQNWASSLQARPLVVS